MRTHVRFSGSGVHFRDDVAPQTSILASVANARGARSLTEIAASYILIAAGTNMVPQQFRLKNFKLWMRTVLVLWWIVLILGTATYIRWYVPGVFRK